MAYQKPIIAPPWGGWNDALPTNVAQMNSFKQITNWLFNKGRIIPFPARAAFPQYPEFNPASGNPYVLLGMDTFEDQLRNIHTLILTQNDPAYFDPSSLSNYFIINRHDPGPNMFNPQSQNPFAIEIYSNQAYFANGGNRLAFVIGDGQWYSAGDVPGTCFFLGQLDAHLLMINTVEPEVGVVGSTRWPARVRWSASGNPNVWLINPATGLSEPTAGFVDITDVEDELSGYTTMGNVGYAFRQNGITTLSVTGTLPPFKFENFSIGPKGIGCKFPYTLASFGNFCCFVGTDDLYMFDGAQAPQRIGGNAKKTIFADLATSADFEKSIIVGRLWPGVDYLSWWICIPQASGTVIWVYHFDDQTWIRETVSGNVSAIGQVVIS